MKSKKTVSHNKIKNSAFLFEMLVKQLVVDTMQNKSSEASILINKYFNRHTEMGKELYLYKSLLETKNISEAKASNLIDIVLKERKKLDEKKLLKQKYNLIREIKEIYPLKDFLSTKITDYKAYASIYKLFLSETVENNDINNFNDVVAARFNLMEHLSATPTPISEKDELLEKILQEDQNVRLMTYQIVVDKFNKKYSSLISEQKHILKEYISNASNPVIFKNIMIEEIGKIIKKIDTLKEALSDDVMKIKLNEVQNHLNTMTTYKKFKTKDVIATMIAHEICKTASEFV